MRLMERRQIETQPKHSEEINKFESEILSEIRNLMTGGHGRFELVVHNHVVTYYNVTRSIKV